MKVQVYVIKSLRKGNIKDGDISRKPGKRRRRRRGSSQKVYKRGSIKDSMDP